MIVLEVGLGVFMVIGQSSIKGALLPGDSKNIFQKYNRYKKFTETSVKIITKKYKEI